MEEVVYWLQLGGVNGEPAEGVGLSWRWGGNQRKAVARVESGAHLIEGTGGEVAQQALEAVHRETISGEFAGALAQCGRRRLGRGDDRGALAGRGCGILVIEQHGFEALAHMPFDMA